VPQLGVPDQICPSPAREGEYIDYRFPPNASGLFGKELPGRWLSAEEANTQFRRLYRNIRMVGPHNGMFRNIKNRYLRISTYSVLEFGN
jgi:hypothetical protein